MYETKNWKSQEQKKKESRIVKVKTKQPSGISCEMQLYAKSIAGVQDSEKKLKRSTKAKGKTLKNASRSACKIMLKKL